MTTLDVHVPDTFFLPGMHAWGRSRLGQIGIVLQNANGAVEYWCNPEDGGIGELVIHAPQPVRAWAEDPVAECPIAGGLCFEGVSMLAYRELILPLLDVDDIHGVLRKLGEIHDGYFGTRVTG